jgi:hypothetical protein
MALVSWASWRQQCLTARRLTDPTTTTIDPACLRTSSYFSRTSLVALSLFLVAPSSFPRRFLVAPSPLHHRSLTAPRSVPDTMSSSFIQSRRRKQWPDRNGGERRKRIYVGIPGINSSLSLWDRADDTSRAQPAVLTLWRWVPLSLLFCLNDYFLFMVYRSLFAFRFVCNLLESHMNKEQ